MFFKKYKMIMKILIINKKEKVRKEKKEREKSKRVKNIIIIMDNCIITLNGN